MPMTKAEMEEAYSEYHVRLARARDALRTGQYRQAIKDALEAWPFIDGMMQYARKYKQAEFDTVAAIDLVLDYVPVLFDFRQLDQLEGILKECRRIERDTTADLGEQLANARARMWTAHRLWDYIETHPAVRQAELRAILGGQQSDWVKIIEVWEKMGLMKRTPEGGTYRLSFSTRMGEIISGKCPECGSVTEAPKAMLLGEIRCPSCEKRVTLVLVPAHDGEA